MIIYDKFQLFEEFCKTTKKWGIYIKFNPNAKEVLTVVYSVCHVKSNPDYLNHLPTEILMNGFGFLIFDSEEEMNSYFNVTVYDNVSEGTLPIWALSFGPDGIISENS